MCIRDSCRAARLGKRPARRRLGAAQPSGPAAGGGFTAASPRPGLFVDGSTPLYPNEGEGVRPPRWRRYQVSMQGRFLPLRGPGGGAAWSADMIQRRDSAGSITSSSSKWLAVFSALPRSYDFATS